MKKGVSILFALIIIFSGVHFTVATHYCGGSIAATKVSLTGELATCGMESPSDNNSTQNTYTNNCCEDISSAFSVCPNYIPSSYFIEDQGQQVNNMIAIPVSYHNNQETIIYSSNNNIRPPGTNHPNCVDLQVLCIFRI